MEKNKIIPSDFMTVGQLAKKMGTTIRTLQYYHKEGLLTPSSESQGGRRLYTDKDMVKLHQILSLKSLGFSLESIKEKLIALDTPRDVANTLTEQASAIQNQLESLSKTLSDILSLREEVLQMQTVDFKKYADIISTLQMNNKNYRLIKYLDDRTLDHARKNIDKSSASQITESYTRLSKEAILLLQAGTSPDSEEGQKFAEEFWAMILKFTGGDMSLLPSLLEAGAHDSSLPGEDLSSSSANDFIGPALESYFSKLGTNPFEGVSE